MTDSTFVQETSLQAGGHSMSLRRYGGAEGARAHRNTVLIVPGACRTAAEWDFVGERFGRHFDTYVLDLGHAGLADCAAALGLQNWAAVGHADGARVVLSAAVAQPAGLARLALVAPPHLERAEIEAELTRLQLPVLLLTAGRGGGVSEDDVFEMEIALPGLTEVRVEDAGPMIPWDQPEAFFQAFGAFLGATLDA